LRQAGDDGKVAGEEPAQEGAMSDQDSIVERVARAMCAADGHDPDAEIESGQHETVRGGRSLSQEPVRKPKWTEYEQEARRIVAAHGVLSQMEWPGKLT
jgi:hypothetical protein